MKKLPEALRTRPARVIFTLLAILLTAAILAALVISQWDRIITQQWQVRWDFALLSFLLFSLDQFIVAQVWVWVINHLGANIHWWQQFRYFSISNLMRRLPGTVWYVAWRAQMYGQNGLSASLISLASGIEMAVYILACTLVTLVFSATELLKSGYGIGIAAVLLAFSLGLFHPRLLGWLLRKTGSSTTRIGYRHLLKWTGVMVVTRLVGGTILFCMANILTPIPLENLGFIIGCQSLVGLLTTALFFSPTNFGFYEVSLSLLYSAIMPASVAVVIAVFGRILTIGYEITWALLSLGLSRLGKQQINP